MSEVPTLRIVPGAAPPTPLSKSAKKKRRAAHASAKGDEHELDSPMTNGHGLNSAIDTALVDHAPAASELNLNLLTKPEDIANAAVASETASEVAAILPAASKRPTSAIVELVNKRHRTLHKKIQRIKEYSSKPIETLNEDQKRSLATLPQLEASSKEVEEVRKAIEVHEAEEAAHEAKRLAEIESIVKQRIADAVAEARSTAVTRTVQLVTIIRELPELRQKHDGESSLEKLAGAIHGSDQSHLETTIGLFVAGQGDYTALIEILNQHLAPPAPAPAPATVTPEPEEEPETPAAADPTTLAGIPSSATMGGSYHFMQESELEPQTPFDEGAEWVEHPEAPVAYHNAPEAEPTEEDPTGKGQGAIDWSAEHHDELPPIAGLQEHFGASGQATPVAETPAADFGSDWNNVADAGSKVVNEEDDGFTTIPNRRGGHGPGDWRGGDRGRGRGGFRGRGTGEWRSGEGHSGGRGGYRGDNRGRGDFRGRARGDWKPRGEYRGRGEGRGEGRGGYRGRPPAESQA